MFTGVVQTCGTACWSMQTPGELLVRVLEDVAVKFWDSVAVGESICVSGVCLTLLNAPKGDSGSAEEGKRHFVARFFVQQETKAVTTFGERGQARFNGKPSLAALQPLAEAGPPFDVNLERSVQAQDRLSGHIILGHVHLSGRVVELMAQENGGANLWVQIDQVADQCVLNFKGSIGVDGVSLAVAGVRDIDNAESGPAFRVALTPHTLAVTTLGGLKVGDSVNVEFERPDTSGVSGGSEWSAWGATEKEIDEHFMKQALELAERTGRVTAPPNPWVGCVLVGASDDASGKRVLGRGAHCRAGEPHAEVLAVHDAITTAFGDADGSRGSNGNAQDATVEVPAIRSAEWFAAARKLLAGCVAYVTLEPCHHTGRTPPCDSMLRDIGVSRVVIAVVDTDARVAGAGVGFLRKANIRVDTGVLETEARHSLRAYLHHRTTARPYVVLKAAQSMDGSSACADGTSQWITASESRAHAHAQLRNMSQAIMVGSGTAISDNPSLTTRLPSGAGLARQPLRVVLDSQAQVVDGALLDTSMAPTLIFTCTSHDAQPSSWAAAGVEVCTLPPNAAGRIPLAAVLDELGRRGILQLLVEGGPTLHGSFLLEGLVDEIALYTGGCLIGDTGKRWSTATLANTIGKARFDWRPVETNILGEGDVFTRYVKKPAKEGTRVSGTDTGLSTMADALFAIARGDIVVVVDDADRENEGDFVMAAEHATPEKLALFIRRGSGIVCAPMYPDRAQALQLPLMVGKKHSQDPRGTAYTLSVDAAGAHSGISAAERCDTIRLLASDDPESSAGKLMRPGHVFPLIARPGGVLERHGHTESAVDLCRLAGCKPVGVITELMDDEGNTADLDASLKIARANGNLPVITVAMIEDYCRQQQPSLAVDNDAQSSVRVSPQLVASCSLPLRRDDLEFGPGWQMQSFDVASKKPQRRTRRPASIEPIQVCAIVKKPRDASYPPLMRVHSQCFTGDVLGSERCDCGEQLTQSLRAMDTWAGGGALVYVLGHEGRGIGLSEKVKAYAAMEADINLDTYAANRALGHKADLRNYDAPAEVMESVRATCFGTAKDIVLLTQNPQKVDAVAKAVVRDNSHNTVIAAALPVAPREANRNYIKCKERWAIATENWEPLRHHYTVCIGGNANDVGVHIGGATRSRAFDALGLRVVAVVRTKGKENEATASSAGEGANLTTPAPPAPSPSAGSYLQHTPTSDGGSNGEFVPEKHAPAAMLTPSVNQLRSIRIAVIRTLWNTELVNALADNNTAALMRAGVRADNIVQLTVPGCYELPLAAKQLCTSGNIDAVLCVGILIKGSTMHFEYLSGATCDAIQHVQLETGVPVIYGVLNCLTTEQARERCAHDSPLLSSLAESTLHMLTLGDGKQVASPRCKSKANTTAPFSFNRAADGITLATAIACCVPLGAAIGWFAHKHFNA